MVRHFVAGALLAGLLTGVAWSATVVRLAADGKALEPVVVAHTASERVRQAAETLARYLARISQAEFKVITGDGARGIAVGTVGDFSIAGLSGRFDTGDIARREEYVLQSHESGLRLIGATDLAVEHAVWDLLYRLGYRQFFPGETWEVVPVERNLSIDVDDFQRPDYLARRIWYGYGTWDYNAEPYQQWCARNRCVQGVGLNTGHSYDGFVRAMRKEFDAHPEYWPLLDGQRKAVSNPKPCLGNPEVRKLFAKYALAKLAEDPSLDSVSMDPSDGGGWCECGSCRKLGSVSDRVVIATNEVAEAIQKEHPGKLVGMYAYAYHSPPPTVRVHPGVVVSVATSFLRGGLSLEEIMAGWSARGAALGIREYYGVNVWDRDMPGRGRGGNLEYLRRTIPEFRAKGARYLSAESSDNWGPNGLGYFLAARMLWDVDEAKEMDALVDDFLSRAFGPAREPMRQFYEQLDGSRPHLVADDQLGRMFRALDRARSLADSPAVRARIDALVLYARYCSLFDCYSKAKGDERQAAFEAVIRHGYRMRTTMMIHTKALYRDLVGRDKSVKIPDDAKWNVPEDRNPWKSSEPFGQDEIAAMLRDGIARHPLAELGFEPVQFSTDLVPAAGALDLPREKAAGQFGAGRGEQTFYTYVEQGPSKLELQITGGLIAHYRDRGNVRVEVVKIGGPSETGQRETPAGSDRSTPPDGNPHRVAMTLNEAGLYRITVNDGHDRTRVEWPAGQAMTVVSGIDCPADCSYHGWTAWFYVPKGTRTIGIFGGGQGELRDSSDRPQLDLGGAARSYRSVAVPPGEDGRLWRACNIRGDLRLMTVPPCFATTPQALLLPREVVERDGNH